ncbi:hypothetical protein L3Q82_020265, partial [Scortum barcoo]
VFKATQEDFSINIELYAEYVTDYISTCTDNIVPTSQIIKYPNQKPWMNSQVRHMLHARSLAFRVRVNPRKAAGPDNIPGRVLRASELADVFTFWLTFRTSHLQHWTPSNMPTTAPTDPLKTQYLQHCTRPSPTSKTRTHMSGCCLLTTVQHLIQVIPHKLTTKLFHLGFNSTLCDWLLDFFTGRPQSVRIGGLVSGRITVNTGNPQGCVLNLVLYSLFTHDCVASHKDKTILKFADDTTVIGLISGGDETAYRREVASLVKWCDSNNLSLNTDKTKRCFKFLGVHICDDLTWTLNITQLVKKAHQQLYFLRRLRKSQRTQRTFCTAVIESILTSCIMVWYGNSTESGENGRKDRPGAAALSAGHQPPQSPQESLQHHQRPLPPPAHTLAVFCPLAG